MNETGTRKPVRSGATRRNRGPAAAICGAPDKPEISGRQAADAFVRVSAAIHDISRLREFYFEQQCRSLGITRAQWWLMYKLSGYEQDAPNQTELAQQIGIGVAAAGEMLSRVEKAGYVRRADDPGNRRAKRVTIMAPGRDLVAAMGEATRDYSDAVKSGLSEQDEALLHALLDRIKRNLLTLLG